MGEKKYLILAFYHFTQLDDPHAEVKRHKDFLSSLDFRARIYLSHQGINAQASAGEKEAQSYMEWLRQDPRFQGVEFKWDFYHEHVFPRLTVKYRQQLVALDAEPDVKKGGEYLSPEKWSEMLEKRDENTILLDVRNDYEWKIGHFEGAELPKLECFRQFPTYAKQLKEQKDPKKTKVMMYCTGGIRCELYSALLKEEGFEEVYQLEGGVIQYGHEMGSKYWRGKLFVFDDRLAVPMGESEEVISECANCHIPVDAYYNCANIDCNELFLLCSTCAEKMQGCCSEACKLAPRVRPFEKSERPKPFKKWYHYTKE